MSSTGSLPMLDEESVTKPRTEEDHLNTSIIAEQDEEDTTLFSETDLIEKPPISSAQTLIETEKRTDFPHQVQGTSEDTADDQPFELFSETECMKFSEKLHKIVEELRMNRISERENELRIRKLMSEKSDLERLKDDEVTKYNELIQKHNQKRQEARKQFEKELLSFQEDKTKHMLEKQRGEKEIKALKDEIRALHITKYAMEKLIKDQERQLQANGTKNSNYLTQLAKLEKQCKDVFKQCSHIITSVDKVQANVNASAKLHKKLTFINEHQNCALESYKERLERKKQNLITMEARHASSTSVGKHNMESPSLFHLEDQLRMQKELCQQVQVQLNDSRQENEEMLKSLTSAHELLNKHVEAINKYAETDAVTQLELDELRTECEKLRKELKLERTCVKEKCAQIKEVEMVHAAQEKHLRDEIEKLRNEFELLSKEKVSLEELNSTWSRKNVVQKKEIENMTKEVNKLESLLEEKEKERETHNVTIARLEDDVKKEMNRYEDLLLKAHQQKSDQASETIKWRERTTELQQTIDHLKEELKELKQEKGKTIHQNQQTQTTAIETQKKETIQPTGEVLEQKITSAIDKSLKPNETRQLVTGENNVPGDQSVSKYLTTDVIKIQVNSKALQKSPTEKNIQNKDRLEEVRLTHSDEDHQVEKCPQDVKSKDKHSTGESEFLETTSYDNSVDEKRALVHYSFEKKTLPGNSISSTKDETSSGRTLPETTTNEKQISAQDTSSMTSTAKQKRTDGELISVQERPSDKNTSSEVTRKGLLPVKAIERETLPNMSRGAKRTPLLAVVKPAFSSQVLCNEHNPIASHVNHLHSENNPTHDPAVTTDRAGDLVQIPSTQLKLPDDAFKQFNELAIDQVAKTTNTVSCHPSLGQSTSEEVQLLSTELKLPNDTFNQQVSGPATEGIAKEDITPPKIREFEVSATCTEMVQKVDKNGVPINVATPQKHNALKDLSGIATSYNKRAGNPDIEDFCFSDEDEESMPRAIGTQIDRIETFLKNERLRLSKKRKMPDE